MSSKLQGWISWVATRNGLKILLALGLGIGVAVSAVWDNVAQRLAAGGRAELLVYQLCVGLDKARCPKEATFVQNVGEDAVAKWTQRECAGYKARRIIVKDAPTPDCGCFLADVRCSSE